MNNIFSSYYQALFPAINLCVLLLPQLLLVVIGCSREVDHFSV